MTPIKALSEATGMHTDFVRDKVIPALRDHGYVLVQRPEWRQLEDVHGRERWDLTELKRRMGVVSPELPGKPTLQTSGLDAIVTGFFSSSTLWPNLHVTDAMRERADKILTEVGAEELRAKPVSEMSAGEQRRVMIGRAMAGASEDGHGEVQ